MTDEAKPRPTTIEEWGADSWVRSIDNVRHNIESCLGYAKNRHVLLPVTVTQTLMDSASWLEDISDRIQRAMNDEAVLAGESDPEIAE